ncbi:MAG: lipoyl(octanoyl) transferase LipB [Pseudomonadota bacterium]|nr:lipoyl(octanoyl) transferase LipB [Pseudomonadota bacterium]
MISREQINYNLYRSQPIALQHSKSQQAFPSAMLKMETHVAAIAEGSEPERLWLLEHPPLYTSGTSAKPSDLIEPNRFPVFETGRGGQYTYHGPGQRVGYVMLNLAKRGGDVRAFVAALEQWLINTLAEFGVVGERREDRVGIWVRHNGGEDKIAAIGIRVRRGITFHGVSLNVNPDLSHFDGIVPCGVVEHGVTSLAALGIKLSMTEVDEKLSQNFAKLFGPLDNSR